MGIRCVAITGPDCKGAEAENNKRDEKNEKKVQTRR